MTSRVFPYRQHPRYQLSTIPSLRDSIVSHNDIIARSDFDLKPSPPQSKLSVWSTNDTVTRSDLDFKPSPSKPKVSVLSTNDIVTRSDLDLKPSPLKSRISFLPTILWIALGVLIFISLVMVIVIPIAVLANTGTGNATGDDLTISTICPTTAITTTVTQSSLPAQCSSYTTITDPTRSPDYSGATSCDQSIFTSTPTWVRFTGLGGTLLASCPIALALCGADAPGWYSGIYPSLAGDVKSGFVCFNFNTDLCYFTNWIVVTNCNGFYVYSLTAPPSCDLRYCTI